MSKPKAPPIPEAEHCIDLRKRAKRGERLTPGEQAFCSEMYKRWPKWYAKTEERVFNETLRFGSTARWKR